MCSSVGLEMSSQSLTSRMLASMASISQGNVKSGNLAERQWGKIVKEAKNLDGINLFMMTA